MRVLQVTSEAFPLVKTGGLADVATALSRALVADGDDVRVLMPAYRGCAEQAGATAFCDLGDPLGVGHTRILTGTLPDTSVGVWLVDCPALFDRDGGPYLDAEGGDWNDNHLRFGLLCRAAAMLGTCGAMLGWAPDIIHGHDWQAGLVPAYLRFWGTRRPATLFTIHNLHFHGRFDARHVAALGLPSVAYDRDGLEFYGSGSFLKAGLYYADRLTTVSPTYATEIQTVADGQGLHGLLRSRAPHLTGILNGIDEQVWDPRTDREVRWKYGPESLHDKRHNKDAFQEELGLWRDNHAPLLGWVGRLTHQKGIDLVLQQLPFLLSRNAQLAVIGSGESPLEHAVEHAAKNFPGRVAFYRGYNETLSHRLMAGADMLLVPSRFEPCGLTQMYAMRYGTIPIVRETGGLCDTVIDAHAPEGTGYTFLRATPEALGAALARALEAYYDRPHDWRGLQHRGMHRSMGWSQSAAAYRALYRAALGHDDDDR